VKRKLNLLSDHRTVLRIRWGAITWYVGGINGQNAPRDVSFAMPFLKKDQDIAVLTDGREPGTFETRTLKTSGKKISLTLPAKSGFVGTIR
jgi:hypothetical protein